MLDNAQKSIEKHERHLGLVAAISINMSNMVGAGTFFILPLLIGSMGGPQALFGWFVGALLAIADGMVWSELASAFPGTGGSYVYLRESFGKQWGRLFAFMFAFQLIVSGPLEIASSNIGLVQYASYIWHGMTPLSGKLLAAGVGVLATVLLYRRITAIGKVVVVLCSGMLVAVGWVVLAGFMNFKSHLAFSVPPHALAFNAGFFFGLGSATLYSMYCYLGYYAICYLGGEVRDPSRTIWRSIVISIAAVFLLNVLLCLSVLGVIPWKEVLRSPFIVAELLRRLYGNWAGVVISMLIVWSAFASSYTLILAYSRVPYAAAVDGNFFDVFSRLHASGKFPHISLLLIGSLSVVASFFDLAEVIAALMTSRIVVQFIAQVVAVFVLRKYRPDVYRPFKMVLYPLSSAIALGGWLFVFLDAGARYIGFGLLSLVIGGTLFLILSRRQRRWPFLAL